MIFLLLTQVVCICVGAGMTAVVNLPLYWGLLAGWLGPSALLMLVLLPNILHKHSPRPATGYEDSPEPARSELRGISPKEIDKAQRHRHHVVPWGEQREVKV